MAPAYYGSPQTQFQFDSRSLIDIPWRMSEMRRVWTWSLVNLSINSLITRPNADFVNFAPRQKLPWNVNHDANNFSHEDAFQNAYCKMVAICSMGVLYIWRAPQTN